MESQVPPPPQQQSPSQQQVLPQAPSLPPLLPPQQQVPQQPNFVAVPFNYPKVDSYSSEVVKDGNTCEGRENFFVKHTHTYTHNIFFSFIFLNYRFSKIKAKKHIFPLKFMLL